LKSPNDSWKLDETYVKVKGKWLYLYRAIDSRGQTIDFYLSKTRNQKAAKLFLGKLSRLRRSAEPRTLTVDRHPSYPAALSQLQSEGKYLNVELRQSKYLNNIIEQDHRRIKWKARHSMGYFSYKTAFNTIRGIETMHMLFKGQLYHLMDKSSLSIKKFINRQFGLS